MKFETVRKKIIRILYPGNSEPKEYTTYELVKLLGYKKTAYAWVWFVCNCLYHDDVIKKVKRGRRVYWVWNLG